MNISLTVQIYDDGQAWERCWSSIKENLDLLEHVFISINRGSLAPQEEVISDSESEKIHFFEPAKITKHGEMLLEFDNFVASFNTGGHILRLDPHDVLLREGLLELRSLELSDSDGAFGAFVFTPYNAAGHRVTAREFRRPDGLPVSSDFWGFLQKQQLFAMPFSGTVIPAKLLGSGNIWHKLHFSGSHSAACHLCDRRIKRIFQPFSPVAEIRKAAADPAKANEYDEFIYLLTVFSLYSDFQIRLFITRTLLYTMMPDWRKSLPVLSKAFAATLFTAPCCFSALRIIGYILLILLQKIKNSIKLRIRK